MIVGERRFAITLANTDAARAFAAQLPLTLDMAEFKGVKSTAIYRKRCQQMRLGQGRFTTVI
jgi:hypothetical protein